MEQACLGDVGQVERVGYAIVILGGSEQHKLPAVRNLVQLPIGGFDQEGSGEPTTLGCSPGGREIKESSCGHGDGKLTVDMSSGAVCVGRRNGCVVLCVPARSDEKGPISTQLDCPIV